MMTASRAVALALAVTFGAVGLMFLFAPAIAAIPFEEASRLLAIRALPTGDIQFGLFRVLAAAYMYLVAWLAWMTFNRPAEDVWPGLLAQAKLASAVFSLVLIAYAGWNLVLVTNAVVDGLLGALALWLRRQALARRSAAPVVAP